MLFNSTEFLRFFVVFLACYTLTRGSLPARNALVAVASYLFYAGWDYRFTALLFLTSLVDFLVAGRIQQARSTTHRRIYLAASLVSNLGVLGFFKYADFAAESAASIASLVGLQLHPTPLGIVLPVGISFYTFQSISYTIDVYRGGIPAETSFLRFAGYIAFFPQLVAGPIERAQNLLPQFRNPLRITSSDLREGFGLMTRGLFKKVVIADPLGRLVELSHDTPGTPAPILVLGTLAFGFQIYCDFSGYSDMARGVAQWLGFRLSINFDRPYLSKNVQEFWRTWHISLSTWLRDYLYIPLGGSRHGQGRMLVALLLTMLLGGLWHGARVNFLLWGAWHGFALMAFHLWRRAPRLAGRMPDWVAWGITMVTVFYGWLLFRAAGADDLLAWHQTLASDWSWPHWGATFLGQICILTVPLMLTEIGAVRRAIGRLPAPLIIPAGILRDALLLSAAFIFWTDDPPAFIYFQF